MSRTSISAQLFLLQVVPVNHWISRAFTINPSKFANWTEGKVTEVQYDCAVKYPKEYLGIEKLEVGCLSDEYFDGIMRICHCKGDLCNGTIEPNIEPEGKSGDQPEQTLNFASDPKARIRHENSRAHDGF